MKSKVERIYICTLRLEKHKKGTLVLIYQDIDEALYEVIKDNLYRENHKGKVELGYTESSGVKIRIATSDYHKITALVSETLDFAQGVVQEGVVGYLDNKMNGARYELAYSLRHLRVLTLSNALWANNAIYKSLKGLDYKVYTKVKNKADLKEVNRALLVPPDSEAIIN